jgi:hypothetical protein
VSSSRQSDDLHLSRRRGRSDHCMMTVLHHDLIRLLRGDDFILPSKNDQQFVCRDDAIVLWWHYSTIKWRMIRLAHSRCHNTTQQRYRLMMTSYHFKWSTFVRRVTTLLYHQMINDSFVAVSRMIQLSHDDFIYHQIINKQSSRDDFILVRIGPVITSCLFYLVLQNMFANFSLLRLCSFFRLYKICVYFWRHSCYDMACPSIPLSDHLLACAHLWRASIDPYTCSRCSHGLSHLDHWPNRIAFLFSRGSLISIVVLRLSAQCSIYLTQLASTLVAQYVHLALSQLRDVLPYLCSDNLCFHFLWKKSSSKEMSIVRDPWFFHFCWVEVGYRSWVTWLLGQVTEWSCPWLYPISYIVVLCRRGRSEPCITCRVLGTFATDTHDSWLMMTLVLLVVILHFAFCTILLFSGAFHDMGHILSLLASLHSYYARGYLGVVLTGF